MTAVAVGEDGTVATSGDLLRVEGLCAGYGASRVLDGVSFSMGVEPVCVIGRNGMG
jgi:branched-chain amino acid transport system ATP-binding protein